MYKYCYLISPCAAKTNTAKTSQHTYEGTLVIPTRRSQGWSRDGRLMSTFSPRIALDVRVGHRSIAVNTTSIHEICYPECSQNNHRGSFKYNNAVILESCWELLLACVASLEYSWCPLAPPLYYPTINHNTTTWKAARTGVRWENPPPQICVHGKTTCV